MIFQLLTFIYKSVSVISLRLFSYILIVIIKTTCKKIHFFSVKCMAKGIESVSEITTQLISGIIVTDNEKYVPFISTHFNFILFSNLIGLNTLQFYSATSRIIVTFTLFISNIY